MIQLRDVAKSYHDGERDHIVLHDVSLHIDKGQFVALVGPSGSGKSTLLNLIGGIDQPDGGTVQVAGNVLNHLDDRARTLFRRQHIGFVFQFFNLVPTLTVEENLLLPLELNGITNATARVRSLLERVGLYERMQRFPDQLSGGEQQRVAIARALVHSPALILADEPTGNLDAHMANDVLDLLEELARSEGRTLLVVTHSSAVAKRADRVLAMADGQVVEGSA